MAFVRQQAELPLPFEPLRTQCRRPAGVTVLVLADQCVRSLQRPVRGRIGRVGEYGLLARHFAKEVQHQVGEVIGGEAPGRPCDLDAVGAEVRARIRRHQWTTVEMLRAALQERETAVEAAGRWQVGGLKTDMPLAGHQRRVAGIAQQLGDCDDALVQVTLVAGLAAVLRVEGERLRHRAHAGAVVVHARQQHRAGR